MIDPIRIEPDAWGRFDPPEDFEDREEVDYEEEDDEE